VRTSCSFSMRPPLPTPLFVLMADGEFRQQRLNVRSSIAGNIVSSMPAVGRLMLSGGKLQKIFEAPGLGDFLTVLP